MSAMSEQLRYIERGRADQLTLLGETTASQALACFRSSCPSIAHVCWFHPVQVIDRRYGLSKGKLSNEQICAKKRRASGALSAALFLRR